VAEGLETPGHPFALGRGLNQNPRPGPGAEHGGEALGLGADRRRRFLEKGKLYQVSRASNGRVRVWDDSGEDREYPAGLFRALKLSSSIQRALASPRS